MPRPIAALLVCHQLAGGAREPLLELVNQGPLAKRHPVKYVVFLTLSVKARRIVPPPVACSTPLHLVCIHINNN